MVYELSNNYTKISNYLSSQVVSNQVLSAYVGLTTVFGMGTGGAPQLSPLDAANQNFDVFPKFFVSRSVSIGMLTSLLYVVHIIERYILSKLHRRKRILGLMVFAAQLRTN